MKQPSISRPIRRLASEIKEWAVVGDAFVDFGETTPEEVRAWVLELLPTLHDRHPLRHEWEKASEEIRAGVWRNWERLRGKTLAERAVAHVERHNGRLRAKHPLFADDPVLMEQIGAAYKTAEKEAEIWRGNAEKGYAAARDPNRPPPEPSLEEKVRARFLLRVDEPMEGRDISINQCRVWANLLCYHTAPDCNAALREAERLWPDAGIRHQRLCEIRAFAEGVEFKRRREERLVAAGELKVTQAWPSMREVVRRAYAAIVYLTG